MRLTTSSGRLRLGRSQRAQAVPGQRRADEGDAGHSPIREQRAQATRRAILTAARELFGAQGYAATTVREIAERAGFAPQTVYASAGSKQDIVRALIDLMEEDADLASHVVALKTTDDPVEHIRLQVGFSRRIFSRGQDIVQIARGALSTEGETEAAWDVGNRHHREGIRGIIESWRGREILRAGLTPEQAADIFATMTSVEVFQWLVTKSGWSGDEYESWLNATLPGLLLENEGGGGSALIP